MFVNRVRIRYRFVVVFSSCSNVVVIFENSSPAQLSASLSVYHNIVVFLFITWVFHHARFLWLVTWVFYHARFLWLVTWVFHHARFLWLVTSVFHHTIFLWLVTSVFHHTIFLWLVTWVFHHTIFLWLVTWVFYHARFLLLVTSVFHHAKSTTSPVQSTLRTCIYLDFQRNYFFLNQTLVASQMHTSVKYGWLFKRNVTW